MYIFFFTVLKSEYSLSNIAHGFEATLGLIKLYLNFRKYLVECFLSEINEIILCE